MLKDEQKQFIVSQVKTDAGQEWLKIHKDLVEALYSSRGINSEDIKPRQIAAEIIEQELVKTAEVGEQESRPAKNNEYK